MNYVFDTSAFSQVFRNHSRLSFPRLWTQFDRLVSEGRITSTREVMRELEDCNIPEVKEWILGNCDVFPAPCSAEARFVRQVFSETSFQQSIKLRTQLNGGKNADVFVVARAKILGATVVTQENERGGTGKIPIICKHYRIRCKNLQQFMNQEQWIF